MAKETGTADEMPQYMKYIIAGLSGMSATCVVQPFDLIKTRMQVSEYKSPLQCFQMVYQNEGILALYKGISASLLRQATYTTTRLGIYSQLNDKYKEMYSLAPTMGANIVIGMSAGGLAAFVGTPAEVGLIRMMSDGRLPTPQRRAYKNVFNALNRIVHEEGVLGLFRGASPTVLRAIVTNASQISAYTQFKSYLHNTWGMAENFKLQFVSTLMAACVSCVNSMPLDTIKTRIQNMKVEDGKPEYTSMLDVLVKVTRKEGVMSLYKGFTPYLMRIAPHVIMTLIFVEQLSYLFNKYVLGYKNRSSRF